MLRILWFNWRCWLHPWAGGAEVHVREVAKRLVEQGNEVTLFCGKYGGCKEHEKLDGVEIIRKGDPYTVYLQAMKEYLWHLRKRVYDCVIDDINGVPFFTPLYVKVPKVAIMHHFVKEIFFKELPWHKAVIGCAAEKMIGAIYRNTSFIAVSESTKKNLVEVGVPHENINVVYNGIDHSVYKPSPHTKSPFPHILYMGRIRNYKKVDHLIRAMKFIIDAKQLNDVKLTIAGKGSFKGLKSLAAELNLNSEVDFLGEVSEKEKITLLDKAWVYVTASSREGWGLTVTEANACGTPAIAYNVPGLKESIINGQTGLLVKSDDEKAFAEQIMQVLQNDLLRHKLRENALRYVKEFSWDKTAEHFVNVLEQVVNGR